MNHYTRRQWLIAASASSVGALWPRWFLSAPRPQDSSSHKKTGLDLGDFEPRSMLHVPAHPVERARFPVIDIHTHLAFSAKSEKGVAMGEERKFLAAPEELLEVMDRKNIRTMVNLTGGTGAGLAKSLKRYDQIYPGPISDVHGTIVEPQPSSGLPEVAGRRNRAGEAGRRTRIEDSQNAGTHTCAKISPRVR